MTAQLEHANITVTDPAATATWMKDLFGWDIRWQGPAIDGGHSIHVGTDQQYLALYAPSSPIQSQTSTHLVRGGLNHLAVTVVDIAAAERAVIEAGFAPHNHADYEPGHRFYFQDHDGIEYEVVQYD